MKPKPIREAVVKLYMSALIAQYRALGVNYIELDVPALETIRGRADFTVVIDHLAARGLVEVQYGENGPRVVALTDDGMHYLEDTRDKNRARRWENTRYWITTGIAILALLVAIVSLMQSTGRIDISRWPPRLLPQESTRDGATVCTHAPASWPSC